MRIYKSKNNPDITFEFTERIYENKIKSFSLYAKKYLKSFYKRKQKVKGVFYTYTWGFKTKEPYTKYSRTFFPIQSVKPTLSEIVNFATLNMNVRHEEVIDEYDDLGRFDYYLRGITVTFVYENIK
jgi:hypothetical protein